MNFSLTNLKFLEINHLIHSDNYLPDYQPDVKRIITVALSIIFTLLILGIITIIVAAVLSQSLYLLGLLTTICLIIPIIVVTHHLLKKYSRLSYDTQNLPLNAVTNFSIKEKIADSLTITVRLNNGLSKEIVFVSQPFSQVLKNLSPSEGNVPGSHSPTGYVCVVNKNGSSLYPLGNKACCQKIRTAWKSAQSQSLFSVGQINSAIIFTKASSPYSRSSSSSQENIEQLTDSTTPSPTSISGQSSSTIQPNIHSYLFLTHPYKLMSSLASFCEALKLSYKNIFETASEKKIKELHLPLLGINPNLLENKIISQYKNIFSSKILLQSLFEGLKKQTSIEKVVVFIDRNSMIEELLYSNLSMS